MTTPIAHVRESSEGCFVEHRLSDHLLEVAQLASEFASPFQGEGWAAAAGRWHDLGKYSGDFQNYIRQASGYERQQAHVEDEVVRGRVDHSTAGAIYAIDQWGLLGRVLAYLIAGHHAGLPDWEKLEEGTGGALRERLAKKELLANALKGGLPSKVLQADAPKFQVPGGKAGFALWVRMLFSALVDADFLDTEAFMDDKRTGQRGGYCSLTSLREPFDGYLSQLQAQVSDTAVNRLRSDILHHCREKAEDKPGFFSLTVPTGGGKTLSGMAFALDHAIVHRKRRVIHVIPYTSIIEQTADTFRGIFGEAVIEHHSSLDPDRESARSRLATENWDAPIIVTTSVQFFESLFAARTSRCRKLHNIVNSVVVLDEAQLLPPEFLQPILTVLNLLVEHYGVSVVFSTATQPALQSRKDTFGKSWMRGIDCVEEIIPDPSQLYQKLDRVEIQLPDDLSVGCSWQAMAESVGAHESVLVIVNTRRQARQLHALLPAETVHLSALMCGEHRSRVIGEIKRKLSAAEPVRVVSTQLVEAGVDLDFPVVFRALAGLDSIAQAAGRCNREGRLAEKGEVIVFVPPEPAPAGVMRRAVAKTISVLALNRSAPLARENFTRFFELFYADCDLDKQGIEDLLMPKGEGSDALRVQFRSAAQRFRLIDEQGQSILVRYSCDEQGLEIDGLLNQLKKGDSKGDSSRRLMRKLQRYSVTVSEWHFCQLQAEAQVEEVIPGLWAQCKGTALYDPILGVALEIDAPSASYLVV